MTKHIKRTFTTISVILIAIVAYNYQNIVAFQKAKPKSNQFNIYSLLSLTHKPCNCEFIEVDAKMCIPSSDDIIRIKNIFTQFNNSALDLPDGTEQDLMNNKHTANKLRGNVKNTFNYSYNKDVLSELIDNWNLKNVNFSSDLVNELKASKIQVRKRNPEKFHRHLMFSPISFSDNNKFALTYYIVDNGGLAKTAILGICYFSNQQWMLVEEFIMWVS